MNDISKEYGTAIFAVACEEGEKELYLNALREIKALFLEEVDYLSFLASPSIPQKERLAAIDGAFAGKVPEYVLSYLKLLCEKGRIPCLIPSIDEFEALYDASNRIMVAKITSAAPLDEEEKEKLIAKLEKIYKGRISGEYTVDISLLGGIIVEVDGKIMDGSLRHRLREVKEVMNT